MDPIPRATSTTVPVRIKELEFKGIVAALAAWKFPEGIDGVIAIASGGIVPGALVAQRLGVGLKTIAINYRNEVDEPMYVQPRVLSSVPGLTGWRRVLLVDDVYLTGKSWEAARACLPRDTEVLPFVLKGEVDFALFRGNNRIEHWPWAPY